MNNHHYNHTNGVIINTVRIKPVNLNEVVAPNNNKQIVINNIRNPKEPLDKIPNTMDLIRATRVHRDDARKVANTIYSLANSTVTRRVIIHYVIHVLPIKIRNVSIHKIATKSINLRMVFVRLHQIFFILYLMHLHVLVLDLLMLHFMKFKSYISTFKPHKKSSL